MSERPEPIAPDELAEAVEQLDGWQLEGDALCRTFEFDDFVAAFGFMASAALVAERINHHPDWSNVYSKVTVELSTHDVGGITRLDLELAEAMNALA